MQGDSCKRMIDLGSIDIRIKVSVVFGVLALVLSFLLGIISGIPMVTVLIRTLIMTIVFAGLGYTIVFIVVKFVPEFKQIISGQGDDLEIDDVENENENENDINMQDSDELETDSSGEESDNAGQKDDSFAELNKDSFPDVSDSVAGGESGGSNLGKHIVKMQDGFNKFEPKLMAAAVRTMMSKDED
jgi:hypothetical protein